MQNSNEEMEPKPDSVLNSSRICRFCLSPAGVMSPIFEERELNSLPLSSKIMAFISVQVHVNDGLPSLICHRCLYQVEKSYDFKTQCEASDAMLRKYLSVFQSSKSPKGIVENENIENFYPTFDTFNLDEIQKSLLQNSSAVDSPFKRKRGRPRKEENLVFYNSPHNVDFSNEEHSYPDDEIKIVDGIESLVTVVDPRSEILSNSDDEIKEDNEVFGDSDTKEIGTVIDDTVDSLAKAKAKAKKYMGVVINVSENGNKIRKHLCKGCGKTFGHCSDLRKHVLVHTGERPFRCRICAKTFSRSTNLNKHMKLHTGQKPYFCTDCPKSFLTKGDLQRHVTIHSGIKPFACHLCSQCFSRKDKLKRHLKFHENGGISKLNFKCSLCSAVLHSKVDLRQHVKSAHYQHFRNDEDDEEEDVKSGGDELSNSKEAVDMKEESSNDEDLLTNVNNGSPRNSEAIAEVESMVINIDPFQVDSDLNEPISTWDSRKIKNESKPSDFTNGTEEGNSMNYLKNNEKAEKPKVQCGICHKKMNEETYLRSHMVTHSGVKPHKCSMCEKAFTRRRELIRHENVHTGYKPYCCRFCGKAFSRKDKFVRHEKTHDKSRKFTCFICSSFSSWKIEDLLLHHRDAHPKKQTFYLMTGDSTSGIQYKCETCFVCFENQKMYQEHLKSHEAKNSSQEIINGVENGSDDSKEEKVTNNSLEQLNLNPAITVTSISKSFGH